MQALRKSQAGISDDFFAAQTTFVAFFVREYNTGVDATWREADGRRRPPFLPPCDRQRCPPKRGPCRWMILIARGVVL
jgi:hypothetical protein